MPHPSITFKTAQSFPKTPLDHKCYLNKGKLHLLGTFFSTKWIGLVTYKVFTDGGLTQNKQQGPYTKLS